MDKKVVKIAIIISWCLLLACMIFKLCGSEVFEIAVTDTNFIKVCNWLDTDGIWFRYILMFVMSLTSNTIIVLASALKPKVSWKWMLVIIATLSAVWGLKFTNDIVAFVAEAVSFIILPSVISKKWYYGFIGVIINLTFQILSMFIRGQEFIVFESNTILSLVMTIDYYIMIALYYLYAILINKKREEKLNG